MIRIVSANEIRRDMIIRRDGQNWLVSGHMPLASDTTYPERVRIQAECVDGDVGSHVTWEFAGNDPVTIIATVLNGEPPTESDSHGC